MSVVIVGGTRGIGHAIAKRFSEDGHKVTMGYLSNDEAAQEAVEALPTESQAVKADVGELDGVLKLYGAAEKFGPMKIVIHSAVIPLLGGAITASIEDFDTAYKTGPRAFLLMVQQAAERMKDGGHIITVGSIASGPRYVQGYGILGPAKCAMDHMVAQLGCELAPRNIRVNCISTSTVESHYTANHPKGERMMAALKARTPAGRAGTEADVADTIAMICSKDAHWIVGQTIVADGGMSLAL
jgi:NAD(P)-dependent dehydrogenase (short-subunit alcohol dehydrogenase family)